MLYTEIEFGSGCSQQRETLLGTGFAKAILLIRVVRNFLQTVCMLNPYASCPVLMQCVYLLLSTFASDCDIGEDRVQMGIRNYAPDSHQKCS